MVWCVSPPAVARSPSPSTSLRVLRKSLSGNAVIWSPECEADPCPFSACQFLSHRCLPCGFPQVSVVDIHGCLSLFVHRSYIPSCNYCALFWRKEDRSCRYPMLLALPTRRHALTRWTFSHKTAGVCLVLHLFFCNNGIFTRWGC